jgi:hypothetical protein
VIRFSAALVAVAIGVLVGGVAASELSLVYIAIVVSAVALGVLAIGVLLKREELFGEGQGLVPAGAGASPVLSVRVGESHGQSRPSVPERQSDRVPPSPSPGAAEPGAAFVGNAQTASPQQGVERSATRPVPASQERSSGQPSPWETKATRDPWTPPAPDTNSASGPGSTPPSWFDRPDWSSAKGTPDDTAATAAPSGATPSVGEADQADQDDDWPTRYSWLDEEPEESGPDGSGGVTGEAPQAPVVVADAAAPAGAPGDTETPEDTETFAAAATGLDDADEDIHAAAAEDAARPGPASDLAAETEADPPAEKAEAAADAGPGAGLVVVIPGVPRYHKSDCVLIRFMPEGDSQQLLIAQAREAGCTPCTACQPEE